MVDVFYYFLCVAYCCVRRSALIVLALCVRGIYRRMEYGDVRARYFFLPFFHRQVLFGVIAGQVKDGGSPSFPTHSVFLCRSTHICAGIQFVSEGFGGDWWAVV